MVAIAELISPIKPFVYIVFFPRISVLRFRGTDFFAVYNKIIFNGLFY